MKVCVKVSPRGYSEVFFEGNPLEFVKKQGVWLAEIDCRGEAAELAVVGIPELLRPHWAGYAFGFWMLGIFGLFTPRYAKSPARAACGLTVRPDEKGEIGLRLIPPPESRGAAARAAAEVTAGELLEQRDNEWRDQPLARKRRKRYLLLSWLGRIAALAGAGAAAVSILL